MGKRVFILASTLVATVLFANSAEAKCPAGYKQIGPLCAKMPDANPIRDHRCPASQGGNCVGPEPDPVVPPQPQPPKRPLPPISTDPPIVTQPEPTPPPQSDEQITCEEGRRIVKHSGFRHVEAIDCDAPVFKYTAKKHGHRVLVSVKDDGQIIKVINNDN